MTKSVHYLKPAWVRRQFELAFPLLPPGSRLTLWVGGKRLAAIGEGGEDLCDDTPGVRAFPLLLEGRSLGTLLWQAPHASDAATAEAWGSFLLHGLQGIIDAQHARQSVAQETLESYREIALLQRVVIELNKSLKPTAVAAALLKEFDGRKDAADFGAVFLRNADDPAYSAIECIGEGAVEAFAALVASRVFDAMVEHPIGDIIDNLAESPFGGEDIPEFQSLLWLPLIAHGENLGMLVLASPHPESFTAADMRRAQTLVSVATSALHNAQLYAAEKDMFDSFVTMIANAIDAKSPYTAGHCRRVPEIAMMLAETAHRAAAGPFAAFTLDEDDRNALEIAARLHDCGKVITPEWVVDKATKLEAINNRLDLVAMRFEVLRRDALIDRQGGLAAGESAAERAYRERMAQLDDDFAFLTQCNQGGEFVSPEHVRRIRDIAARRWRNGRGEELPLLSEDEAYNLCVQRGTLNQEERKVIEDHARHTITMLSRIRFPRSLRNVTEYAGGHHERVDGKGYPRGLSRDQLSIPARILAIADVFEALTAPDRPYRKGGKLSWAIEVMHRMKHEGHIDGELFDLFLGEGVYLAYARKHLAAGQVDQVEVARYLG